MVWRAAYFQKSRLFAIAAYFLCLGGQAASAQARAMTVREAVEIPAARFEEMGEIRLTGVVTYFKATGDLDFIIQDETGGIFLNYDTLFGKPLPALTPGDRVAVEGPMVSSSFSPRLEVKRLEVIGQTSLPEPRKSSYEEMMSGHLECLLIETKGVVRSAAVQDSVVPPRLILGIWTPAGSFDAWVLRFGDSDGSEWVDAQVRVRGVCLARENQRRQLTDVRLLVYDLEGIDALMKPPKGPFAAPLVEPGSLLTYSPEGLNRHRVRIKGTATLWRPGEFLVMENSGQAVRVRSRLRIPILPGDRVEAAGFAGTTDFSVELQDATYRVLGQEIPPDAIPIVVSDSMRDGWISDHDQKLIRLRGTLESVVREGEEYHFGMVSNGMKFPAILPFGSGGKSPTSPEIGSKLELTGVCDSRPTDAARLKGRNSDRFALLLRSEADMVMLKRGPWLTPRRTFFLFLAATSILGMALFWNFMLRRRVDMRTKMLAREVRAKYDLDSEFRGALGERERVAAELHDTVQQRLTAAALQVEAAGLALRDSPEKAEPHLKLAGESLARGRESLRRSVRGLHDGMERKRDIVPELSELCEEMTVEGEFDATLEVIGEPYPLPLVVGGNVVRIASEAVGNAARHSRGKSLHMSADFQTENLRLVVRDEGSGFHPERVPGREDGHYGISGMYARAEKIGATLSLVSSPGNGTCLTLDITIKPTDEN